MGEIVETNNNTLVVRLIIGIVILFFVCLFLLLNEGKYAGRNAEQWYKAFAELKVKHNALEKCINDADIRMHEMKQSTTSMPCITY